MIVRFVEASNRMELFQVDDWPEGRPWPQPGAWVEYGNVWWHVLPGDLWHFMAESGGWTPYWVDVYVERQQRPGK